MIMTSNLTQFFGLGFIIYKIPGVMNKFFGLTGKFRVTKGSMYFKFMVFDRLIIWNSILKYSMIDNDSVAQDIRLM